MRGIALRQALIAGMLCVTCNGCELLVDFDRSLIGNDAGMDMDGAMPDATMDDGATPTPDGATPDAMPPTDDAGERDAGQAPMEDAGMDAGMDAGEMPMDGSMPADASLDGGDAGSDGG